MLAEHTQIVTFHRLHLNSSERFIASMLTINPGNYSSECYPGNMCYTGETEQSLMDGICSVIRVTGTMIHFCWFDGGQIFNISENIT